MLVWKKDKNKTKRFRDWPYLKNYMHFGAYKWRIRQCVGHMFILCTNDDNALIIS